MNKQIVLILKVLVIAFFISSCSTNQSEKKSEKKEYALVLHGGAGNITRDKIDKEKEADYRAHIDTALSIGEAVLKNGGKAVEAVQKTINYLEDCPLFNAGKGAVFTHDGKNELDASIMDGETLNAGAVAGVGNIKNPINAAIKVMIHSEHVMLIGKGATQFAAKQGVKIVDSSYFFTDSRWKSLQDRLKEDKIDKHGTVGCVALDKHGNICAGTSTGGMTNKKYGRVGDSPIIGAGTYANNNTCGISATGHGEYFIRYAVAHDISALVEYKQMSITEAANKVINEKLVKAGGEGGIVALDKYGNPAMTFNSNGMFRGYINSEGEKIIGIFKDE